VLRFSREQLKIGMHRSLAKHVTAETPEREGQAYELLSPWFVCCLNSLTRTALAALASAHCKTCSLSPRRWPTMT
jgi:hypothetical protein